jgi:hypothetical protein
MLTRGEGEKSQHEDRGEGHHGQDGHKRYAFFVLLKEVRGFEGFREFHGLGWGDFQKEEVKNRFENVLQCKLKEIQRLYKTILPILRFFCEYKVFTGPEDPSGGG